MNKGHTCVDTIIILILIYLIYRILIIVRSFQQMLKTNHRIRKLYGHSKYKKGTDLGLNWSC